MGNNNLLLVFRNQNQILLARMLPLKHQINVHKRIDMQV